METVMGLMQVPESLKNTHDALHSGLKRALGEPGRTGEVARKIMRLMDGHMLREEKFALKPLGLLSALGRGEMPSELAEAVRMVQGLKREMPQMVDEHRQIAELLRELARNAEVEGKPEYVGVAEDLILHAQMEEDVFYPAALLIGAYAALARKV
jgi:hypothetical protein